MGESRGRRRYDREFKEGAVRLIPDGGRTVRGVARDLGIHKNMLHRWRKEYLEDKEHAFPGKGELSR
jgi:transposase